MASSPMNGLAANPISQSRRTSELNSRGRRSVSILREAEMRPRSAVAKVRRLLLAQHQIHHPATIHMLARLSTMIQDHRIVAAALFERIPENGQQIELRAFADRPRQRDDRVGPPLGRYPREACPVHPAHAP